METEVGASMFAQLGGQMTTGQSMFGHMGSQPIGPTADEMEADRQRVLAQKVASFSEHRVKVFCMHDPKQVAAYEKLMRTLMIGVQASTHKLWVNDLQVMQTPKGQQWFRYMEWSKFELVVTPTAPVGSARDTDE
jgi:hypothetical protein